MSLCLMPLCLAILMLLFFSFFKALMMDMRGVIPVSPGSKQFLFSGYSPRELFAPIVEKTYVNFQAPSRSNNKDDAPNISGS